MATSPGASIALAVGDEVDYNVVDGFWVPARVQSIDAANVRLRFAVGQLDVCHRLDVSSPQDAKRLSAACMRSAPLLERQPVDVLRRTSATPVLGASEQWQRGEIVQSTAELTSYGGDRPVAVKVLSTGDAVLGVTYGVVDRSGSNSQGHGHDGGGGAAGQSADDEWAARRQLPPGAGGASLVLADPSHLAPGGCYGKWVPTTADVQPVSTSAASSSSAQAAPQLRDLGKRARAFFKDSAEITARFSIDGRRSLRDYDLIDILPRPSRRKQHHHPHPHPHGHRHQRGHKRHGGHNHHHSLSDNSGNSHAKHAALAHNADDDLDALDHNGPLAEALRRLHGPSLGHVGDQPLERQQPLRLCACCPHARTVAGAESSLVSPSKSSWLPASSAGGKASSSATCSPSDALGFDLGYSVSAWYTGRIRYHAADDLPTGASSSPSSSPAKGAAAPASASPGRRLSSASDHHHGHDGGGGPGPPTPRPYVYWFEPALGITAAPAPCPGQVAAPDSSAAASAVHPQSHNHLSSAGGVTIHLHPVLRMAPLEDVLAIAPVGTYSLPYVPGQRIDSRRPGGTWCPCKVVYADRYSVRLQPLISNRPARGSAADLNATHPKEVAKFSRGIKPMRVILDVKRMMTGAASGGGSGSGASASTPPKQHSKQAADVHRLPDHSVKELHLHSEPAQPAAATAGSSTGADAQTGASAPAPLVVAIPSKASRKDRIAAMGSKVATPAAPTPAPAPPPSTAAQAQAHPAGSPSSYADAVGIAGDENGDVNSADCEDVPHHMWQYLIARAGHYCSIDAAAEIEDFGGSSSSPGHGKGRSAAGSGSAHSARERSGSGAVSAAAAYVAEAERTRRRAGSVLVF